MVRFLNRFIVVVLIVTCFLAFVIYHDDMDVSIPYIDQIFIGLAILLAVLLFIKINYRWQAVFVAKKAKVFFLMSKKGLKKAAVFESIHLGFYSLVAFAILMYSDKGFWTGITAALLLLEGIVHLGQNLSQTIYRTVVQDNAITIINNHVTVIPWKGLKKVETRHNDIRFVDELDNVYLLDLDIIDSKDHAKLISSLKSIAREKKIYFEVPSN